MRTSAELREGFLSFFEERGHLRCPSCVARPTCGGRLDAPDDGGHAPADAVLPRPRAAAGTPDDDVAEVLPDRRHRRGRARRPPPDVLRDARELLVRPVLQGGRDRVRARVRPGAHEARLGPRLGDGPRRRPAHEARARRGRDRALEEGRDAARADRPAADLRELLVGRRSGAVRAGLGDLLGLGRGVRLRRVGLRTCVHALRPLPRVLEPRLHGVRAARRRHADAAAEAEHRHRPRARAGRRDPAGRPLRLRDGRLPADHGLDRRRVGRRVRRLAGGDEGASHPCRPRTRDDLPRERRRDAVERGSRATCCAASSVARSSRRSASASTTSIALSGVVGRADERRVSGAR